MIRGAMTGRPMSWSSRRALGVFAVVLPLAGCATMPSTGAPPSIAGSNGSSQSAQQVVVVAEPPKATDKPMQLLSGFLDDLVSDEQDYRTAKQFLTKEHAASWDPQQQVTVLDGITMTEQPGSTASHVTIVVSGHELAVLDAKHAYQPGSGVGTETLERFRFGFSKGPQGWRIDELPPGVILNQVDFGRIYESTNLYFPVTRPGGETTPTPLAADPIYVRSHLDPLTDAANALLNGPSKWLGPAVTTGFPKGSSLDRTTVEVNGDGQSSGSVQLQFSGALGAQLANPALCDRMAAQLFFTLSQVPTQQAKQAGLPIDAVTLTRSGGSPASCTADQGRSSGYSPLAPAGDQTGYFVDSTGHLQSLDMNGTQPVPSKVTGVLAPVGAGHLGGFAVAPGNSGKVAVLSHDRNQLYVSTLTASVAPGAVALASAGPRAHALSTPSWDALGTLWVADRNPADPAVYALVDGVPVRVPVDPLHGGTVTDVKVATDGARIALIVAKGGSSSVQVGRIQRSGSTKAPEFSISGLRSIAPDLSVKSVSWVDGDSLVVLGQSAAAAKGLSTWEIDGSSELAPSVQQPPTTDGMTTVAAMQQAPKAPLLADSSDFSGDNADKGKVYWLKTTWKVLATNGDPDGPMPSYPG